MEEEFVFKSITIPVSHFKKEGVICPFCKSLQKRYISHIRKEHRSNPDISSNEDFENFEIQMRTFIHKLKQREYREGQKEKDAEGFASKHKEEQRKYVKAKRQLEPEKLKSDQKKWDVKSMEAYAKQFERKMRYGPIFPCVCCHCLYFEDQVVPFDPDKIEKKAREAHEKKQKEIQEKRKLKTFSKD
jgi:hypothetical protein